MVSRKSIALIKSSEHLIKNNAIEDSNEITFSFKFNFQIEFQLSDCFNEQRAVYLHLL